MLHAQENRVEPGGGSRVKPAPRAGAKSQSGCGDRAGEPFSG